MSIITGLRQDSCQNLVLNEGAFLLGFEPSKSADSAANLIAAVKAALSGKTDGVTLLGATAGGGSFKAVPTTRVIDIDGMRGNVKGATQVDSWDLSLTGTLKELKAGVFAKLCLTGESDTSVTGITKIKIHANLDNDDYLPHLCWVGSTPTGMVLISLTNVLNKSGITMTFQDKNEATIPFEFSAHQEISDTAEETDDDYLPVEIYWLTA